MKKDQPIASISIQPVFEKILHCFFLNKSSTCVHNLYSTFGFFYYLSKKFGSKRLLVIDFYF